VLGLAAAAGGGYWYVRNLAEFGNPFYPLSVLGFQGMPMDTVGGGTFLKLGMTWFTYPWLEHPYNDPFEGGVGAVFGALCIPAMLLSPLLLWQRRRQGSPQAREAWLVYGLVAGGFVVHGLLENLDPRYTLAPILLSSVLIGILWRESGSRYFRAAACLPFAAMVFLLGESFFNDLLYWNNRPHPEGAARFELPGVIDEIMPARILNAGPAYYTYGLMGKNYQNDVVSLFADATPADALKYRVDYVFAAESDAPKFQAALNIALLADMKTAAGKRFSLWRVVGK
jgi:hypothetical protein